jgi:hypothetical protein
MALCALLHQSKFNLVLSLRLPSAAIAQLWFSLSICLASSTSSIPYGLGASRASLIPLCPLRAIPRAFAYRPSKSLCRWLVDILHRQLSKFSVEHILTGTEAQASSSFSPPSAPFPTFALDGFALHSPSLRFIGCDIPYLYSYLVTLFLVAIRDLHCVSPLCPTLILSLWPERYGATSDRTSTSFKSSRSSFIPSTPLHIISLMNAFYFAIASIFVPPKLLVVLGR